MAKQPELPPPNYSLMGTVAHGAKWMPNPFSEDELAGLRSRWAEAAPDLLVPRLLATLDAERSAHSSTMWIEGVNRVKLDRLMDAADLALQYRDAHMGDGTIDAFGSLEPLRYALREARA